MVARKLKNAVRMHGRIIKRMGMCKFMKIRRYKYIRCKIKNIATDELHSNEVMPYLELTDNLPNDCIRLHSAVGWCYNSCQEAVCEACKYVTC